MASGDPGAGLFLTVRQVADMLGMDPSTVYRICRERKIAHRRIGTGSGRIVFTRGDLDAYIASCVVPVEEGHEGRGRQEIPLSEIRRHFRPQGEKRR